MFKSYLISISALGLENLCTDDDLVADYFGAYSTKRCIGLRAVVTEDLAEMVHRQLNAGQKRLALATLDAGAIEVSRLAINVTSNSMALMRPR